MFLSVGGITDDTAGAVPVADVEKLVANVEELARSLIVSFTACETIV